MSWDPQGRGCHHQDLAKLLWVQATLYASRFAHHGFVVMTSLATAIHTPKLALSLLPPGSCSVPHFVVIVVMCIAASSIALLRVRKSGARHGRAGAVRRCPRSSIWRSGRHLHRD